MKTSPVFKGFFILFVNQKNLKFQVGSTAQGLKKKTIQKKLYF